MACGFLWNDLCAAAAAAAAALDSCVIPGAALPGSELTGAFSSSSMPQTSILWCAPLSMGCTGPV